MLLVVIVLGVHDNFISNKVGRVEAYTKLTDHGNIRSRLESLHKSLRSRLGDGSQIVNKICLGHSDTRVNEGDGLCFLVWNDLDEKLFLGIKLGRVCETLVTNFVLKLESLR